MIKFPTKIVIIGMGLIGGSIAMGLKRDLGTKITILGLSSSHRKAKHAKRKGIIDLALSSIKDIPQDADLIILAAPIHVNLRHLKSLKKLIRPDSLLIDVGSTKEVITKLAKKISLTQFIGTHPMAGGEVSGIRFANPNLFHGKPWIICPSKNTTKKNLSTIKSLSVILGAKPVIMNAVKHDELTSLASHLFLVISSILLNTITKSNWITISQIASTGLKDSTRLASHNPDMKTDIVITNKKNVLASLRLLKREIDSFSLLVGEKNLLELTKYFTLAKKRRDKWLDSFNLL